MPVVLLALFILGGLVVDGSRDLDARGDAQAYAEEAARAVYETRSADETPVVAASAATADITISTDALGGIGAQ